MQPISAVRPCLAWALLLLFAATFLGPSAAGAQEARLNDIVVTNTPQHLLAYFTVTDCFTPDMRQAIENGIPTTFNFYIVLSRQRSFWFDAKLAELNVTHEIQYDSLKNLYAVRCSEGDNRPVYTEDFEEAKRLMSEIVGLKVIELQQLQRNELYSLDLMAELDKIQLPFHLHYVLFFLSLWDFETEWYRVEFRY